MSKNNKPEKVKGEIQKLFNIVWSDDSEKTTLDLISNDELNDASWGAWFGEIQDILKLGHYQEHKFTQCNIDLRYCLWADPLPLLSISVSLKEYELIGGNINIIFPAIPSNHQILNANTYLYNYKKNKNYSNHDLIEIMEALLYEEEIKEFKKPNIEVYSDKEIIYLKEKLKKTSEKIVKKSRFLKYLYREGFLTLFSEGKTVNLSYKKELTTSRTCKFGNNTIASLPTSLNELPVSLAFERSTCLVATILELDIKNIHETFKKIDKWVEQQLHQSISQVVYEEVPSWAQGDLQYRLIILLRETLHNIAEHAYEDKDNGFAAVYIRYREGALGEDSTTWGRLEQFAKREANRHKTPLLQTTKLDSFSNTRSGFFEVFVLDSGQGLFNSLKKVSTENEPNNLHQAMLDVFIRNNTSKGKSRSTEYGGLFLLRELLAPHQDYFRVRDEDAWWGTSVHSFDTNTISNQITLNAYGKKFGKKEITGLAWTVRMSWLEAQDHSGQEQLWRGVENKRSDEQAQIRKLYRDTNDKSLSTKGIVILDSRFSSFQKEKYFNNEYNENAFEFLFLPRPLLMKNVIQDEIKQFLTKFYNFKIENLVIGDIPSEEAITYLAAIVRANKFLEPPFEQIKRIVIITRELRVCVLTKTAANNLFEVNKSEGNNFFKENLSDVHIHKNIINYLQALRKHDSHRIKKIVTKLSSSINNEFIKEEVVWSNGKKLKGYLDFPQSLTHPICREIYSLSLKRLIGASLNVCRLESLDSFVDSLVTRFNAQIHPRLSKQNKDKSEIIIQIGSIKVTGYTEESEHQEDKKVFHFFQHPSGNLPGYFLLPWIGTSEDIIKIKDINQPYMRVGKTPVIARGGWKSYEIPRFDLDNLCVYEKTPRESYQAWQDPSRSPMKLGHWVYGGHHEIFTVNLLLAFNSELEYIGSGNSLANYIYANLFRVFAIKEKDLNSPSKSLIKSINKAHFKHILPISLGKQKPLLVYPSHPVTDHIVNEFLCLLEDEALSRVRANLIAILPVRRHRSGSGLQVSGLTLERLNKAIDQKKKRPVVYFDDAVISGRTFIEIKCLLRGMGYGDIYSIIILDRQRLPSIQHLKNDKHVGFWRLDAPSMGSKAHCPLCHAIDKVIAIKDTIVSEVHRQRINEWCQTWKELDPSTQWGSQGLRPIPLNLRKPNRRFCLRYNYNSKKYEGIGQEKDQEILLTNSAGLIAWVTELHTVTSRDDVSIRFKVKESENLSGEVCIQLLASQLLLFSAEFDTKQAEELALNLIEELWALSGDDRHSALACLTLISCIKNPFNLAKHFLDSGNLWPELKDKHIDFVLFVVIALISNYESHDQIRELEKNENFEPISRLLRPHGKPDFYYRLHREVWDSLGKAHSSPLQRFVDNRNTLKSQTEITLISVLASVSQINVIAINIFEHHWHWLRAETRSSKNYYLIIDEIKKNTDSLQSSITGLIQLLPIIELSRKNGSNVDTKIESKFTDTKIKGKELLDIGKKLHSGLFSRLGIQEIKKGDISFPFANTIQNFIDFKNEFEAGEKPRRIKWHKLGKNETKRLFMSLEKTSLEEAFVVWDEEIKEAVRDVFSNVSRIDEEIVDPWNLENDDKAHLWCRIQLSKLTVNIEMKNKTANTAEDIENKTKKSHSHSIINDIGGSVSYSNSKINKDLLLTIISLPYAHTLQIQQKGKSK